MGKKGPAANWAESEAGKETKPEFGGNDTRLLNGGKAPIVGGLNPKNARAKGMSLRGD